MQLYSLQISIGDNKSSLVPDEAYDKFYKHIANSVLKENITESIFFRFNIPITIQLSLDWESESVRDNLENLYSIINTNDKICLLLHISDVMRGVNYGEVLTKFSELSKDISNKRIVVFVKDETQIFPYEFDINILNEMFGISKQVALLNEKGNYFISNEKKQISNFEEIFNEIKLTKEDNLNLKLIRKVGHFKKEKEGKHISCQKYFYDGSNCVDEISSLLEEQVVSKLDTNKSFSVFYYAPYSQWAMNCFLQINENLKRFKKYIGIIDLNTIFEKIKNFNAEQKETFISKILKKNNAQQILLFIDVVASGTTLRNIYNTINKETNKSILPFCIIDCSSKHPVEKIKGISFVLNGTSENIELNYLLQRKQEYYTQTSCPMCKQDLDISIKTFGDQIIEPKLSSFEMWSMVKEGGVGLKKEIIPIKSETSRFPYDIPNTLEIVKNNGAYLALKFQKVLNYLSSPFPSKGFIIYPDETKSNDFHHNLTKNDVPASLFVSSLKLIYQYNILSIPRDLIEEIKKDESVVDSIETEHEYFYRQLLDIRTAPVIIIDEFPRTYRTYKAMRKVLEKVDKTPLAYITIFNYSPDRIKEELKDIQHANFYEFQIN